MQDEQHIPSPQNTNEPPVTPETSPPPTASHKGFKNWDRNKIKNIALAVFGVGIVAGFVGGYIIKFSSSPAKESTIQEDLSSLNPEDQTAGLQLDPARNYGDKYADGILPVGDNQFSTTKAVKGQVYVCNANFVPAGQAGAQTRGPWFVGTTQWNVNKKTAVRGSVNWQQQISNKLSGQDRIITTNDLPGHPTGTFPVSSSDPAYQYDRNPNTIKAQSLTYTLNAEPTYGAPRCMGGEVGVMLTGVALFNAFDAGGRDAGAWEVQDGCQGHPQSSGLYHYHTLSSCIKDASVSTVIGFALDGFAITGPKVSENNYLTTYDLDECHGLVSDITLEGKKTKQYHYVMTQDFPYSVSCFRSKATESPGQHLSGGQQQQQPSQQQSQQAAPPPPPPQKPSAPGPPNRSY